MDSASSYETCSSHSLTYKGKKTNATPRSIFATISIATSVFLSRAVIPFSLMPNPARTQTSCRARTPACFWVCKPVCLPCVFFFLRTLSSPEHLDFTGPACIKNLAAVVPVGHESDCSYPYQKSVSQLSVIRDLGRMTKHLETDAQGLIDC